jgi:hypothetical protein
MPIEEITCEDYPEKTASDKGPKVEIKFNFDCGDNLKDACDKFGEETVFEIFKPALRLRAQKASKVFSRRGEDVQAKMDEWKPFDALGRTPRTAAEKVADFKDILANMSPEKRAELLAEMAGELSAV